jgi:hypothetical protein
MNTITIADHVIAEFYYNVYRYTRARVCDRLYVSVSRVFVINFIQHGRSKHRTDESAVYGHDDRSLLNASVRFLAGLGPAIRRCRH